MNTSFDKSNLNLFQNKIDKLILKYNNLLNAILKDKNKDIILENNMFLINNIDNIKENVFLSLNNLIQKEELKNLIENLANKSNSNEKNNTNDILNLLKDKIIFINNFIEISTIKINEYNLLEKKINSLFNQNFLIDTESYKLKIINDFINNKFKFLMDYYVEKNNWKNLEIFYKDIILEIKKIYEEIKSFYFDRNNIFFDFYNSLKKSVENIFSSNLKERSYDEIVDEIHKLIDNNSSFFINQIVSEKNKINLFFSNNKFNTIGFYDIKNNLLLIFEYLVDIIFNENDILFYDFSEFFLEKFKGFYDKKSNISNDDLIVLENALLASKNEEKKVLNNMLQDVEKNFSKKIINLETNFKGELLNIENNFNLIKFELSDVKNKIDEIPNKNHLDNFLETIFFKNELLLDKINFLSRPISTSSNDPNNINLIKQNYFLLNLKNYIISFNKIVFSILDNIISFLNHTNHTNNETKQDFSKIIKIFFELFNKEKEKFISYLKIISLDEMKKNNINVREICEDISNNVTFFTKNINLVLNDFYKEYLKTNKENKNDIVNLLKNNLNLISNFPSVSNVSISSNGENKLFEENEINNLIDNLYKKLENIFEKNMTNQILIFKFINNFSIINDSHKFNKVIFYLVKDKLLKLGKLIDKQNYLMIDILNLDDCYYSKIISNIKSNFFSFKTIIHDFEINISNIIKKDIDSFNYEIDFIKKCIKSSYEDILDLHKNLSFSIENIETNINSMKENIIKNFNNLKDSFISYFKNFLNYIQNTFLNANDTNKNNLVLDLIIKTWNNNKKNILLLSNNFGDFFTKNILSNNTKINYKEMIENNKNCENNLDNLNKINLLTDEFISGNRFSVKETISNNCSEIISMFLDETKILEKLKIDAQYYNEITSIFLDYKGFRFFFIEKNYLFFNKFIKSFNLFHKFFSESDKNLFNKLLFDFFSNFISSYLEYEKNYLFLKDYEESNNKFQDIINSWYLFVINFKNKFNKDLDFKLDLNEFFIEIKKYKDFIQSNISNILVKLKFVKNTIYEKLVSNDTTKKIINNEKVNNNINFDLSLDNKEIILITNFVEFKKNEIKQFYKKIRETWFNYFG